MIINRTKHLVEYIEITYPQMQRKKFDVAKVGRRIYLFAVNIEGNLIRTEIFRGNLPMVNEVSQLRTTLDTNIKDAIKKLGRR